MSNEAAASRALHLLSLTPKSKRLKSAKPIADLDHVERSLAASGADGRVTPKLCSLAAGDFTLVPLSRFADAAPTS